MFLTANEAELSRLARWPGVTDMRLDFGYERRPAAAIQIDFLPADLLLAAGSLGIAIVLSLYPCDQEAEDALSEAS
jgi:hypothetical protein